jgi:hypothetical protein
MSVKYFCDFCLDEIKGHVITMTDTDTKNFCDYGCLKLYIKEKENET